jgi:rod shape-determining protein MreB and related proteins
MRTMNQPDSVRAPDPAARQRVASPAIAGRRGGPAAVAIDLGSGQTRLWIVGNGIRVAPSVGEALSRPTPLVRRGRIVDAAGCVSLLTRLLRNSSQPMPAGPVVVACRSVLATGADQDAIRRVVNAVFAPCRLLLVDTVRAAMIGSGAAAGVLLVADVGAQLTEVAVLVDGRVVGARQAEIGTHDPTGGSGSGLLAGVVTRLVVDIRADPRLGRLTAAARARGLIVAGDGASRPELTSQLATNLGVPVRPVASPRLAALSGAGLAAMAACRHPAAAVT